MTEPSAESAGRARLNRLLPPLAILAIAGIAYHLTTTFDRVPPILKRGIQPSDFPQLVIGLIAALSIWLLIRGRESAPRPLPSVVWVTMAVLLVFPILTAVDLFLALGVSAGALAACWGERRIPALLLVSVLIPVVVFLLFDLGFEIRFPRGLLTNLWYG